MNAKQLQWTIAVILKMGERGKQLTKVGSASLLEELLKKGGGNLAVP